MVLSSLSMRRKSRQNLCLKLIKHQKLAKVKSSKKTERDHRIEAVKEAEVEEIEAEAKIGEITGDLELRSRRKTMKMTSSRLLEIKNKEEEEVEEMEVENSTEATIEVIEVIEEVMEAAEEVVDIEEVIGDKEDPGQIDQTKMNQLILSHQSPIQTPNK